MSGSQPSEAVGKSALSSTASVANFERAGRPELRDAENPWGRVDSGRGLWYEDRPAFVARYMRTEMSRLGNPTA